MEALQDRFAAVTVAYNNAALKYQTALIDYKTGPEVINTREIYLMHQKEYEDIKNKIINYQNNLYNQVSKSKK
jgi:hypothetical protein